MSPLQSLPAPGAASATTAPASGRGGTLRFAETLRSTSTRPAPLGSAPAPRALTQGAAPREGHASARATAVPSAERLGTGPGASTRRDRSAPSHASGAADALERVAAAQRRMDAIVEQARRGVDFTPAQLLALQGDLYRAAQTVDLAGRVVEKATGGLKQILQTSV